MTALSAIAVAAWRRQWQGGAAAAARWRHSAQRRWQLGGGAAAVALYNQTDESIDLRVSCQIVHSRNIVSFRSCLFKY